MNEAFRGFWNDLNAYYGKNQTNPAVIYEYEKETKGVPASRKQELFSHIVRNYDYFPKLSEFAFACDRFRSKVTEKASTERCVYCLGSGLIKYRRKVKGLTYEPEYFAACVCSHGEKFKNKPALSIEQVYGSAAPKVLAQLAERNCPDKSVSQLKQDVFENMSKFAVKNEKFQKESKDAGYRNYNG